LTPAASVLRAPAVPYVAPFVVFLGYLAFRRVVPLAELADQILCLAITGSVLILAGRPALDFRVRNPAASIGIGIAVFALWVLPDYLIPGYRNHWLFSNSLTGEPSAGLGEPARGSVLVLVLRTARASLLVPVIEEIFWRGWLMRWLISTEFQKIPIGAYSASSFWISAVLFASEHGPFWDVGLTAGILYNWWIVRTKSLGDLILAHGVTNACLSAFVVIGGRWEYWA
jgi:CAAX prenyl protease-like protein